jgi:hypothetical protein
LVLAMSRFWCCAMTCRCVGGWNLDRWPPTHQEEVPARLAHRCGGQQGWGQAHLNHHGCIGYVCPPRLWQ